MKSTAHLIPCVTLCAITVSVFALSGCGEAEKVEETTAVAPPLPVSGDPSTDNQQAAVTGDMPGFSDEPDFSDSPPTANQPPDLADLILPGPDGPSGLDPLRLPEPAPVNEAWREEWITSFEQAKAKAQKENKDILINFTGSDWCTWCIRLAKEVFSQPGFAEYAKDKYILVEADFPMSPLGQPEAIDPQHQELSDTYEFQGFPTIMLFDKQGRPFAQTGYQPGGPQAYNAHLEEFRLARVDRDTSLIAATKLQGAERAKKLDDALGNLPSDLLFPAYESVVEEIIKLDADNTAELRSQYEDRLANHQFMVRVQAIEKQIPSAKNPDTVLADIAKVAKEFGGDPRRNYVVTMFQINVLNYFDRIDEVLAVAATALKNESLDNDYKANLFMTQLRILNQAERQKDALTIANNAIAQFKDDDSMTMQFMIARADFLHRLDRVEEGRQAIAEARKVGGPAAAFQIDQIEQEIFGSISSSESPPTNLPEPTTPASTEKPAAATSTPAPAETSKPDAGK
jgi:thiol-disulfide isomerase/thioredoxin